MKRFSLMDVQWADMAAFCLGEADEPWSDQAMLPAQQASGVDQKAGFQIYQL